MKKQTKSQQYDNVLNTAGHIIYGDREQTYGDPSKNLKVIADFWSTQLNAKYGVDLKLDCNDVCGMMILLKQARLINSPEHKDSLVDICGYAALQERCQNSSE